MDTNDNIATKVTAAITASINLSIVERYKAITDDLNEHKRSWEASTSDTAKTGIFAIVAEELTNFLNRRQEQIQTLFDNSEPASIPVRQYNQNNLLTLYLEEAIRDWDDIKKAAYQRDFYGGRSNLKASQVLNTANWVANLCFNHTFEAGLFDPEITADTISAICYFDKGGSIISAPYTNLPLIGIPITTRILVSDLQAILHEMGHYVYWHLPLTVRQTIIKKAKETSLNLKNWHEEVFADVFASHVGGQTYDQQFRELLLSRTANIQDEFGDDDRDHPPTLIRPVVLGDSINAEADGSKRWEAVLTKLKITEDDDDPVRKTELRQFANFLRETYFKNLASLEETLKNPQPYNGPHVYKTQRVIKPLVDLRDCGTELSDWNKDLNFIIGLS